MNQQKDFDHGTLSWVKRELDETLQQSADALQRYSEDIDDRAQLQLCAANLHQVHGILRMLELQGAAMLAEEMESLGQALLAESVAQPEQSAEVLMRAILQLRGYLERVDGGQHDAALLILPLVNDLRAVQGRALITESALFAPDLSCEPAAPRHERSGVDRSGEVAREVLPAFQRGLLAVLRGQRVDAGLKRMITALEALDAAAPTDREGAGWWIGSGLMEALRSGQLDDHTAAVRGLVGQLERHIRGFARDEADPRLPESFIRGMLFYVARVEPGSERLRSIHDTFGLDALMSEVHGLERAREGLFGPGTETLRSVAEAIMEDLAGVKDTLDLFVRGGRDREQLGISAAAMRRMADTLGLLGLATPRRVVREQAEIIEALAESGEGGQPAAEKAAEALLYVESALNNLVEGLVRDDEEDPARALLDGEYRQVHDAAIVESVHELGHVKESLTRFLESHEPEALEGVLERFDAVRGALTMVGLSDAEDVVRGARSVVDELLVGPEGVPPLEALDDLAEAISGLEYYLETVADDPSGAAEVLQRAGASLARLGYEVAAVEAAGTQGHESAADGEDSAGPPVSPVVTEPEPPPAPEAATDFSRKRGRVNLDVPVRDSDTDEEILEVFIEEAGEVMETLQEVFPRWRANPEDHDALLTTRRMFHTLKGSGRLVGALLLGEVAWSIENLLNRVLDHSVEPLPEVPVVVDEAMALVPPLVAGLRGGDVPETESRELMSRAAVLSDAGTDAPPDPAAESSAPYAGEGADDESARLHDPFVADEVPEPGDQAIDERYASGPDALAPAVEPEIEDTGPEMDPVLYEIFRKETEDHLATVEAFLTECERPGGSCRVDERVVRALHTLAGSARMAGVAPIARLGKSLEALARARQNAGQRLEPADLDAMDAGAREIRGAVEALGTAGASLPDLEGLIADVSRRHEETIELEGDQFGEVEELVAPPPPEAPADWLPPLADIIDFPRPAALAEAVTAPLPYPDREDGAGTDWPAAMPEPLRAPDAENPPSGAATAAPAMTQEAGGRTGERCDPDGADYPVGRIDPLAAAAPRPDAASAVPPASPQKTPALPAEPEFDQELSDIFLEEFADIVGFLDETVERMEDAPDQEGDVAALHRSLHTLKGGARLAGYQGVGQFCHALESLAAEVAAHRVPADDAFFDVLRRCLDELQRMLEEARDGHLPAALPEVEQELAGIQGRNPESAVTGGGAPEQDLFEVFLEEADEILTASERMLHEWRAEPGNAAALPTLQRALHTLKGGARMAGLQPIADLGHRIETVLGCVESGSTPADEDLFDALELANDHLIALRDAAADGSALDIRQDVVDALDRLRQQGEPGVSEQTAPAPGPAVETSAPAATADREDARRSADVVRVRADLLDDLVNNAGEVSIYRARLEQQTGAIGFNVAELDRTVARLRDQLRDLEIETETQILYRFDRDAGARAATNSANLPVDHYREDFDPLEMDRFSRIQELSRALSESVSDLASLHTTLETLNRETETLLLQQSRVNTALQDGLMRTRMVPFANLVPRMRRIVRQAARELSKQAGLKVLGAEGEMDRTVLERVIPPLEHMLRNAVAHGIESPSDRVGRGKPEAGAISVSLDREGADVVIRVADDGAGMNLDAIRRKAVKQGLMREDVSLSDREVTQFVLESGFSTAEKVTQIAGRGVGMDVVNSEIKQLGGSLEIDSERGRGTRFTVRLPFTLALNQALLCQAGDEVYAIPLSSIDGVVRMESESLEALFAEPSQAWYEYAGTRYSVRSLQALLGAGEPTLPAAGQRAPLILAQAGDHRMAIQVDGLLGSRDIVVKSVGAQISSVPGIFGATILADGRVVMILDVSALIRIDAGGTETGSPPEAAVPPPERRERPVIMVVDDSITMRKVATRLIERNDMIAITAKDGVDAVAALQDVVPDAVLLDIEMPRMDGFELATHMRNDDRLRDVPIIMITSRTGDKHRERALEIGVDRYLGKPYQESELLDTLAALVGTGRGGW